VQASVGSHCLDCVKAAQPPVTERVRRWNAGQPLIATKVLLGLNVAVFLIGLYGPWVAGGEWYRLVTSGFVHLGLLHLAMNMWVLWILGQLLEPPLGRLRFVSLYFASLLAGAAGVLILDPNALTVGASGAIFGLLGAAVIGLRHRGINIWRTGIGQVLIINLVLTFTIPGISIGGHIGGLVGGFAAGWVLLHPMAHLRRPMDLLAPLVVGVVSVVICVAIA